MSNINLRAGYFKEGQFYINNLSQDVLLEVVQILEANSRYTRFVGRHWNMGGPGRPWLISDEPVTYRIFHGDSKDWHTFDMEVWCSLERPGDSTHDH